MTVCPVPPLFLRVVRENFGPDMTLQFLVADDEPNMREVLSRASLQTQPKLTPIYPPGFRVRSALKVFRTCVSMNLA